MTNQQYHQLADQLIETSTNVYRIVEAPPFNYTDFNDSDFDKLKEIGKVFRCENCSFWKSISDESSTGDMCTDCEEFINESITDD